MTVLCDHRAGRKCFSHAVIPVGNVRNLVLQNVGCALSALKTSLKEEGSLQELYIHGTTGGSTKHEAEREAGRRK